MPIVIRLVVAFQAGFFAFLGLAEMTEDITVSACLCVGLFSLCLCLMPKDKWNVARTGSKGKYSLKKIKRTWKRGDM